MGEEDDDGVDNFRVLLDEKQEAAAGGGGGKKVSKLEDKLDADPVGNREWEREANGEEAKKKD